MFDDENWSEGQIWWVNLPPPRGSRFAVVVLMRHRTGKSETVDLVPVSKNPELQYRDDTVPIQSNDETGLYQLSYAKCGDCVDADSSVMDYPIGHVSPVVLKAIQDKLPSKPVQVIESIHRG